MRFRNVKSRLLAVAVAMACATALVPVMPEQTTEKVSAKTVVKKADGSSQDTNEDGPLKVEETDSGNGNASIKTYDSTVVERGIISSHTDKSSELAPTATHAPTTDRAVLSCDSDYYDSLGFSASDMQDEVNKYATSEDYQNPLSGYTFMDPNELQIGSVCSKSAGGSDHEVRIFTCNNVDTADPSQLVDSIDNLPRSGADISYNEGKDQQTHNGIGFDSDGDGIDEFAYLCLYENDGSKIYIDYYRRDASGNWQKGAGKGINMDSDNYVLDIGANQSKGYTAMAAGDYNGDGKEELAFYMPDVSHHKHEECKDARIVIMSFDTAGNGTILREIKLSSIRSDFDYFGKDWYLPTVSLSNSHMRLGDPVSDKGSTKYNPACDLVINVNIPKKYGKSDKKDLNSSTAIYSFSDDKLIYNYEYKADQNSATRIGAINTCEGDLNGDGYDEVILAGLKETGLTLDKKDSDFNHARGNYETGVNYINILYYDNNDKQYKMRWSNHKEIKAPGNLSPNHYDAVEPIALCAGHYDGTTPTQTDQVCVQGVFFSCDGTKITGATSEAEFASDGTTVTYCVIPDTAPYHEVDNYPDNISFNELYTYDITRDDTVAASSDKWIDTCTSGRLLSSDVECVAIVSSDDRNANDDRLYMDVSLVASYGTTTDGNKVKAAWKYKAYNDYLDNVNEDDNGTSLYTAFINSDKDSFYYRYVDTMASYSAPVLYTVLQAPPSYREANSVAVNKFSVKSGVSNYLRENASIGLSVSTKVTGGVMNVAMGGTFSKSISAAYTHNCTHASTVTHGLWLKSDKDYAVCYVIPVVVNVYDIIRDPSKPDEVEQGTVEEPMKPVFTALSLDDYNEAVRKAKEKQEDKYSKNTGIRPEVPADYNAPIIEKSDLPKSMAGDPYGYGHDKSSITPFVQDGSDSNMLSQELSITNDPSLDRIEMSFDQSTTKDNSIGLTGSMSAGFVIGAGEGANKVEGSITGTASLGVTAGRSNTDGCTYTVDLTPISSSMMDGVSFSDTSKKYAALDPGLGVTDSSIAHYDPSGKASSGINYQYGVTGVLYTMNNIKTDMDFVMENGDYSKEYHPDDTVLALSYFTSMDSNKKIPPEGPTKLTLQGAKQIGEWDSQGRTTIDVTLAWDSAVRDEVRTNPPMKEGYNIYMSDANASQSSIHLVNTEGPILRDKSAKYMKYTFRIDKSEYKDARRFYIVPVYYESTNGMIQVYEGAISASFAENSFRDILDGNVLVVEQPANANIQTSGDKATATFEIAVKKKPDVTGDPNFEWKIAKNGKWVSGMVEESTVQTNPDTLFPGAASGSAVSDSSATGAGTVTDSEPVTVSRYTLKVVADNAEDYIGCPVMCVVTCGSYSVDSNIAIATKGVGMEDPTIKVKAGEVKATALFMPVIADTGKAAAPTGSKTKKKNSTAYPLCDLHFHSSKEKIVQIMDKYKVAGLKEGKSKVTAHFGDAVVKYKVKVKNSPKPSVKKLVMKKGQVKTFHVKGKVPDIKIKFKKNHLLKVLNKKKNTHKIKVKAIKRGKNKFKFHVNGMLLKVKIKVK